MKKLDGQTTNRTATLGGIISIGTALILATFAFSRLISNIVPELISLIASYITYVAEGSTTWFDAMLAFFKHHALSVHFDFYSVQFLIMGLMLLIFGIFILYNKKTPFLLALPLSGIAICLIRAFFYAVYFVIFWWDTVFGGWIFKRFETFFTFFFELFATPAYLIIAAAYLIFGIFILLCCISPNSSKKIFAPIAWIAAAAFILGNAIMYATLMVPKLIVIFREFKYLIPNLKNYSYTSYFFTLIFDPNCIITILSLVLVTATFLVTSISLTAKVKTNAVKSENETPVQENPPQTSKQPTQVVVKRKAVAKRQHTEPERSQESKN